MRTMVHVVVLIGAVGEGAQFGEDIAAQLIDRQVRGMRAARTTATVHVKPLTGRRTATA